MNVYDFDNTIYDGESARDFIFSFISVRPSVIRYIPKVILAFAKYAKGKVTNEQMMTDYAPVIKKVFCEYDKWEEFTIKFWDRHMNKIKDFYFDVRRDDDIIVTASPELTINEIAKRLNIKNCVCTKIDNETGEITRLCMRQNKINALREDFGDVEIDNFYTDSIENDRFIAEYAKHIFIVKGNEITQIK